MSKNTAGSGTPDSTEALAAAIERTRHEPGETVEALAAKTDVMARARHRAAEVTGNLRGKAGTTTDKARDAKDKAAEHGVPAIQATSSSRAYSAAAAVMGVLILAWLTVPRRRHRSRRHG